VTVPPGDLERGAANRRDHARRGRRPPEGASRPGAAWDRSGGRARRRWAIAAVGVIAALLGGFLVGVFDIGSGGDARAAAAVVPVTPTPGTPPAATPAPAGLSGGSAVPSEDPAPFGVIVPEAVVGPRYLRAQVGPDGLTVVPGSGSGASDPSTLAGYAWPLRVGRVTQPFGPSPFGTWVVGGDLFHDGLDIASYCGDHVRAAHDGVVLAAGRRYDNALGWIGDLAPYTARNDAKKLWFSLPITVVVDDRNGYRSVYAHFNDIVVKAGDRVTAGQFIGWEGNSGNASGCHLHYGLFSPDETATFALQGKLAAKLRLPATEIARVDPVRVLPPMPKGIEPAEPDPTPTLPPDEGPGTATPAATAPPPPPGR